MAINGSRAYNNSDDNGSGLKFIACLLLLLSIGGFIVQGVRDCFAEYNFTNKCLYNWNLADKSSTIQAKYEYIDKFVTYLDINKEQFSKNDAVWLTTADNSFEYNLKALNTLRDRLRDIQTLDVNSFAYQTAIQQITAQEQGEAHALISIIKGCYFLGKYPTLWGWIGTLVLLGLFLSLVAAIVCFAIAYE